MVDSTSKNGFFNEASCKQLKSMLRNGAGEGDVQNKKEPTWRVKWNGVVLITDNRRKESIPTYPVRRKGSSKRRWLKSSHPKVHSGRSSANKYEGFERYS